MSPRWEPNPDIRTGRHVIYSLHAHLVFVTKYRRDVFDDHMLKRCEEIMREVCGSFGAELREFNGEADHVHLLVHYPPKVALSKLINSLKGVSSRYLRAEYADRINRTGIGSVFWSRSYFAGSCGGAPLAVIRQYIDGQKRPV
ncbi:MULTISPECIES: IS200/IS605 family transposase [unclassified Streptomyces]|uniref:IS200/IS605 family transposase n=1 Tax=unclassified Streptomyces TaxID=2593676 RepID=UPI000DAF1D84|nr:MULTISPECIES: IS200/IS605 family transposase [unclassified Streptomyces]PZT75080.1 IS200/IS605 family transposase [Streptomyces sp. AC1-42T]PZT81937.1 IS200/IS605 family transposase [Streptomyces sp. AC1-42W]